MPISRKQFELGIDRDVEAAMQHVTTYLEDHSAEAFTSGELWGEFKDSPAFQDLWEAFRSSHQLADLAAELMLQLFIDNEGRQVFEYSLKTLVDFGVVSERSVRGVQYYSRGPRSLEELLREAY